ncbi:MAG TPA: 50S ribosomal protein L18 [bacterium]|nr:50S ribosomal protein L18 [bacterium]
MNSKKKIARHDKRKASIRKKIQGTTERPRLSVFRSGKNIYAQVIDDVLGTTLVAASTIGKDYKAPEGEKADKKADAAKVGELIAMKCKAKGITTVVFDRNGFLYHGRVKALAEAARKGGLEF